MITSRPLHFVLCHVLRAYVCIHIVRQVVNLGSRKLAAELSFRTSTTGLKVATRVREKVMVLRSGTAPGETRAGNNSSAGGEARPYLVFCTPSFLMLVRYLWS